MIRVKLAAVKDSKLPDHALRFAFGGMLTVAAGLIAKKFGPGVGGLFLAFPAIFPAGLRLIEKHERERKQRIGADGTRRGRIAAGVDGEGAALGTIALMAFGWVIWRWMPRGPGWMVICAAVGAWLGVAAGMWFLYRVRWMERLRRARRR